jgi:ribosomal protein S7
MDVLEQALKNVGPIMEVRPRRVGGATYQVPMEVPGDRRLALAMRWIISAARSRTENLSLKSFLLSCWMLPATRVLLFASAKKPTRWPKPTALSRIIVCKPAFLPGPHR